MMSRSCAQCGCGRLGRGGADPARLDGAHAGAVAKSARPITDRGASSPGQGHDAIITGFPDVLAQHSGLRQDESGM
jgi:hypothetical protein